MSGLGLVGRAAAPIAARESPCVGRPVARTELPPAAARDSWVAVSVVTLLVERELPAPAEVRPPIVARVFGPKSVEPDSSPPPTALAFWAMVVSGCVRPESAGRSAAPVGDAPGTGLLGLLVLSWD